MHLEGLLRANLVEQYRPFYVKFDALIAKLESAIDKHGSWVHGSTVLQKLLNKQTTPDASSPSQPRSFIDSFSLALEQEADRVRLFILSSQEQLWCRLLDINTSITSINTNNASGDTHAVLTKARSSLDQLGEDVIQLETFMRQNVVACAHLAQLADGHHHQFRTNSSSSSSGKFKNNGSSESFALYIGCMEERLAVRGPALGVLLLGLSDAYETLRDAEIARDIIECSSNNNNNKKKWVPPKQFQRVTRKFWLKPADVTRFKVEVMKNFPILVFGDRVHLKDLTTGNYNTIADDTTNNTPPPHFNLLPRLADQHITDSCHVASIYCDDTEELTSYHRRLRKEDYASLVRVRWYGDRDPYDPNQQLFIERKIHRDAASGQFSTKERCTIAQKDIIPFFQGQPVHSNDQQQDEFLRETQEFVVDGQQQPIIRTCYTRTAFQMSSNNQVRISLDVDLHMIKEGHSSDNTDNGNIPKLPGDWCRDLSVGIPPKDVVHFPYAVVEVKLQAKPPEWLQSLVKRGILLPLPKFSKFLHGTAMLYQHLTENTPHWFLPAADHHDDNDDNDGKGTLKKKVLFFSSLSKTPNTTSLLMTPATWEEMSDTFDRDVEDAAEWLFPSVPSATGETSQVLQLSPGGKQHYHPRQNGGQNQTENEVKAASWVFNNVRRNKTTPTSRPIYETSSGSEEDHNIGSTTHNTAHVPLVPLMNGSAATFAITAAATSPSTSSTADAAARRTTTWPVYQDAAIASNGSTTPPRNQAAPPDASYLARHDKDSPSPPSPSSSSSYRASLTGGASTPKDSAEDMEQGHSGLKTRHTTTTATPLGSSTNMTAVANATTTSPFSSSSALPQHGSFAMAQYQSLSANETSRNFINTNTTSKDASNAKNTHPDNNDMSLIRRSKSLVRTRVEPKTFFANERTFLQWLQISVLVMLTAMSLLSGSSLTSAVTGSTSSSSSGGCPEGDTSCYASRLSGAIIAPVALLFMAYALYMYRKRTNQILRKETVRYDDQRGPVVLVVILIAVFICSYVISIVYAF